MRVEDIDMENTKTERIILYGHLQRMEEGRLPKAVSRMEPPGRRRRGKHRMSYINYVEDALNSMILHHRMLKSGWCT